jgi:hypothetical protein
MESPQIHELSPESTPASQELEFVETFKATIAQVNSLAELMQGPHGPDTRVHPQVRKALEEIASALGTIMLKSPCEDAYARLPRVNNDDKLVSRI